MNNPEKCWLHKVATLSQHPPANLPYYNQICFRCVQPGQINLNESAVKNLKVNIKNNIKNSFNYVCLMFSIQSVGINVIDRKVESRLCTMLDTNLMWYSLSFTCGILLVFCECNNNNGHRDNNEVLLKVALINIHNPYLHTTSCFGIWPI